MIAFYLVLSLAACLICLLIGMPIYYYVKFLRQRKSWLKEMDEREEKYIKAGEPVPPRGYIICEPFGKY